jgi:hypothetical protein
MPSELVGLSMLKMRSGKLTRVTIESVKLPEQFVVENNAKGFFKIRCTQIHKANPRNDFSIYS